MSDIPVHIITQRASQRIGRVEQVRALAPWPAKHDGDHWQLNRAAPVRGNYRQQIRPQRIELGETVIFTGGGGTTDSEASISANGGAQLDYSRQQTFALAVNVEVADTFTAANTPIIPFGFAVVQCQVRVQGTTAALGINSRWNLLVVDEALPATDDVAPVGNPLIESVDASGTALAFTFGPPLGGFNSEALATGPIGKYVITPGKRLAFVVLQMAASVALTVHALITVAPVVGGGNTSTTTIRGRTEIVFAPAPTPTPATGAAPKPPTTPTPKPAPAPAACSQAYVWINWGAAYSPQFSSAPGSAWINEAQNMLRTMPTLCLGQAQQINDEIARVTRNFGASLVAVPIQIAPLISYYSWALQPSTRRANLTWSAGRFIDLG
jgi:hypothetical protein